MLKNSSFLENILLEHIVDSPIVRSSGEPRGMRQQADPHAGSFAKERGELDVIPWSHGRREEEYFNPFAGHVGTTAWRQWSSGRVVAGTRARPLYDPATWHYWQNSLDYGYKGKCPFLLTGPHGVLWRLWAPSFCSTVLFNLEMDESKAFKTTFSWSATFRKLSIAVDCWCNSHISYAKFVKPVVLVVWNCYSNRRLCCTIKKKTCCWIIG